MEMNPVAPAPARPLSAPATAFADRLGALAAAAPRETPADTLPKLRRLLEQVLRAEQQALDNTPWTNLSAAIGFVTYRRQLPDALRSALHRLRTAANQVLHESYAGTPAEVANALTALRALIEPPDLSSPPTPLSKGEGEPKSSTSGSPSRFGEGAGGWGPTKQADLWPDLRVTVLGADRAAGVLFVELDENAPNQPHRADLPGGLTREPLRVRPTAAFRNVLYWARLRPTLRLLDVRWEPATPDAPAHLAPRRLVLEPDYLISVTTVAECLQRDGAVPELALINAFAPDETSRAMVVGNLVNALLDEEVREAAAGRELDFDDFKRTRLFRQNPLQLSALAEFNNPAGIHQLVEDLRRQFAVLRATRAGGFVPADRLNGFQHRPLNPAQCFLEPAFLSARYGLQGRLDLLHESPFGYDLIELKSSAKVPHHDPWENHRAQAMLYRLLLETVGTTTGDNGDDQPARGRTSILYSNTAAGSAAVRPVTADPDFVDRLLAARNALVGRELALAACRTPAHVEQLMAPVLHPSQYKLPPFAVGKAEKVANAWAEADPVERAYALELVRFTARELRLCLLGNDGRPADLGGQAGLWSLPESRKEQNFSLLDGLTLRHDGSDDALEPHLLLARDPHGAEVNFRPGDTLLLYPRTRTADPARLLTALDSQVVKVRLESLTPDEVRLSVSNRHIAPEYLSHHATWALEPDCFDTFRKEWAGVSAFLGLPRARRALLLGRQGPRRPADLPETVAPANTSEEVVERALAAEDWFLLCGPPGTGKTKKVLRTLAERLHGEGKNVLLAAYTNRAVDEISEQLVEAGLDFTRIGSRLSTEPAYRDYLLDARISACTKRDELRRVVQGCQLYVGTVSSLIGKPELFALKPFDVLVVDEASQILEAPMLALLARVPKWVLIGDHKQLPAVVTQDADSSAIAPEVAPLLAAELGLTNLRNSYFERLFRLAQARWPWAHGTLAAQYRMHEELTELVNIPFYDGVLLCPTDRQKAAFNRAHWPAPTDDIGCALRAHRRLFWPTRRAPEDRSAKESRQEARLAARLAGEVAVGYGDAFTPGFTVGIIASYRNQVALIRAELAREAERLGLPALNDISVDTVERYQGSQREVIIVSFCCHFEYQLEALVSLDETGTVDRKLNVALTRAREQLIVLGNEEILGVAPLYKAMLESLTLGPTSGPALEAPATV